MARDIETLTLQMSADIRRFERQMQRMNDTANKRLTAVEAQARRSQTNLSRIMGQAGSDMVSSFRNGIGALAPTLAAAFSAQQVIQYADAYTGLQNRLKATGLEGEALKRVEDSLYEAANRNGVAVAATAELYQRASMARENLGASEQDLLKIVSGTASALKLQGTSATEASGALLQLGQLLGGNTVQAQEYNSLIDQLPVVLEAVAKGSDRWGGSVNKLTKDVKDGKVTVQEWAAAMLKGFEDVEARAGKSTTTVSAALTTLNNELGKYIGQTDSSLSATARMAQGIEALARNLDVVVTTAGVMVTLVGVRLVGAFTLASIQGLRYQATLLSMAAAQTNVSRSALLATTAMGGLRAASLFFLTNPIGLAITAVAVAIGLIAMKGREASPVMRALGIQTETTKNALDAYEGAAQNAANATGAARLKALEHAAALREEASEAVSASRALLEKARAARVAAAQTEQAAAKAVMDRSVAGSHAGTIAQGQYAIAKARYERAADEEFQAGYDYAESANRLERIRANERNGAYVNNIGGGGDGNDKNSTGRNDAERQRQAREDLEFQLAIDRARAAGDEAAIKAAERKQELARLTRQYESAGFEDAAKRAREHQAYLSAAEDNAEAREKAAKAAIALEKVFSDIAERQKEAAQLATDQMMDRLGYEAELARASGDERAIKNAERRYFIEQRTLEILRLKLATSEAEARAMASGEYRSIGNADEARGAAQTIVSVLRADNIWEEAGRRFKDAAWDGVEDLLSQILGSFSQSIPTGGGGNWLQAIAGLFTGGRQAATGRSVTAGYPVLTGERRPEVFVPSVSGTIIPNVNQAMSRMQGRALAQPQSFTVVVNANDAVLTETVKGWVSDGMRQAVNQSVSTSANLGRRAMPDLQHKQRRLGTA